MVSLSIEIRDSPGTEVVNETLTLIYTLVRRLLISSNFIEGSLSGSTETKCAYPFDPSVTSSGIYLTFYFQKVCIWIRLCPMYKIPSLKSWFKKKTKQTKWGMATHYSH